MILKDYEIIDFHTHPFGFGGENICSHRDNLGMTPEHIEQDMRDAGISKMCGSVIMRDNQTPDSLDVIRRSNDAMYKIWDMLGDFYVPGLMIHPK